MVGAALLAAAALAGSPVDAALAGAEHAELRGEPQGQYNAARGLEEIVRDRSGTCSVRIRAYARALVAEAEAVDRLKPRLRARADERARGARERIGSCRTIGPRVAADRVVLLPETPFARAAHPPGRIDAALERRLASAARPFAGWAGVYVHDLRAGRTAGWGADAAFPAASLVKLGVLAAAVRAYPRPERSPVYYDLQTMTRWSSNLAANRLLSLLGQANVDDGLRRLGMGHSTYTGEYRVGTARGGAPPRVSGRVTTARDAGRALFRLQAAAQGGAFGLSRHQGRVALALLLRWDRAEANAGLLPLARTTPAAAKNGWLNDAEHTAAIVYTPRGPRIVVVLTYRDGLRIVEARALGARVARAALPR